MAAEYFEAAEPYLSTRRRSRRRDCAGRTTSGTSTWPRPSPPSAVASFERALAMRPDDVATLVWLGNLHLDQGQPELAEPLFTRALVDATAAGGGALRPRPGGPGAARLRARRRSVRAGAGGGSARVDRPLPARARLSRPGRHGEGRSAPASAGQRGGRSAGSVDGGAARTAARGRWPRRTAAFARSTAATSTAAAGHFRKGVELAPDNPSLRHKLGTALSLTGDTPRRRRAIPGNGAAIAGLRAGPLQPRRAAGVERPTAGGHRTPLGRREVATGLCRSAAAAGRGVAAGRPDGQSLAQYREVLAIDPRVSDARFGYAATLAALGRLREARDAFSEGARLHPGETRFAEAAARVESALAGR